MELLPVQRAVLSVTNKSGLLRFAEFLSAKWKVSLVSTGGTMKTIADAGLPVVAVSSVTGFPEILDGRVKTLHPHIHAGILADKDKPEHRATLAAHGIEAFDLVCVNLYDFAGAVEQKLALEDAVEAIDIGGPCLIRAAAKNFRSMLVAPAPECYDAIMEEMDANKGCVGLDLRRRLASRAFSETARYDALIASYIR
jgi:phosphoribosylaminoimidazolecarboxamide formyltransferase/IMP cyclohydrolase